MKAYYHLVLDDVKQRYKLEGFREPPIGFTSCGAPILPSKGDTVFINGVGLTVLDIIWLPDRDVEKTTIVVYLGSMPEETPQQT